MGESVERPGARAWLRRAVPAWGDPGRHPYRRRHRLLSRGGMQRTFGHRVRLVVGVVAGGLVGRLVTMR